MITPSTIARQIRLRPACKSVIAVALVVAISFSPAGAHNTKVRHVWKKHIKPKLAQSGTINKKGNPVDWTRLKNVPPDFADGVDDIGPGGGGSSSGDITAVVPGEGIIGGGTSGDVGIAADTAVLQRRLDNTCPPGQAIRAVAGTGAVTCEVDDSTTARSGFKDGPHDVPDDDFAIGKLSLPAGKYVVLAKMFVTLPADPGKFSAVECDLQAGVDFDRVRVAGVYTHSNTQAVSFMVLHHFNAPGEAILTCKDFFKDAEYRFLKITAIPLTAYTKGGL